MLELIQSKWNEILETIQRDFEITDVSDVGDDIVVKMKWAGIEKKDIKFASREDVIAWQKKNGLYDETEEYRI